MEVAMVSWIPEYSVRYRLTERRITDGQRIRY